MVIRRKRAKASLGYKQSAPIGIGPTRQESKDAKDDIEAAVIRAVYAYIWKTRPTCQLCHGRRRAQCGGFPDEMHEDPPRSATRGRPPFERFNIIVCGRLCKACHTDVTENRLRIEYTNPALGFLAPVVAGPVL